MRSDIVRRKKLVAENKFAFLFLIRVGKSGCSDNPFNDFQVVWQKEKILKVYNPLTTNRVLKLTISKLRLMYTN